MALIRRVFLNLVLFLIGISVPESAGADGGYLRTAGPPRLRFWPPVERPAVDPMLDIYLALSPPPPRNTATEHGVIISSEVISMNAVAVTNASETVALPTNAVALPPETSMATSGPQGSTIQGVMPQPQLFLQYFTPDYLPGTNGYGYGFGAGLPVSFLPPQPVRTANSSATYQTIPAEKP
jgi:hypothetical protein